MTRTTAQARRVEKSEFEAWVEFVKDEMRPWPCDLDLLCDLGRLWPLCDEGHLRLVLVQGNNRLTAAAAMSVNDANLSGHVLFVCLAEAARRTVLGGRALLSTAEYCENIVVEDGLDYVATTIPTDAHVLSQLFQRRGWSVRGMLPEYQRIRLADGTFKRRDMLYMDWLVKAT